ncbi:FeoB-associated Cys-rich membrane protein [Dyadobacter sp. CY312]|uniref:FeoB-associated Cys-rich membrane protein n=1 Tax=Dyadobacter sp. CY312 TaxID=2907303 RepID=UPI001F1F11D8|nr:FeoB-associated Cys-rich membrane protein [Dyadobacter sp. CY312]MCE7039861.1 FeoB-associated Cys-rich membrane protein [Dyadobacter sp. CY312]
MATQEIIVLVLFLVSGGFIGWKFYKSFSSRKGGGCAKGCGCAADKEVFNG